MLPYDSVEEAELGLGRGLSVGEKIWVKYSAKKPDYILQCHNILFLFLFYTLLPLPYIFIELYFPKKVTEKYKVQPKFRRTFHDMFKCYKAVITNFVFFVGPLQLLSAPSMKWPEIRTDLPLPSISEIVCQLLVYFIIEDFVHYWLHRLLHCKWAYDKIHRVHHEYTAPFGLTAPYAHWAELLILGFGSFVGPMIVPCHMLTFWLWFIVRQLEAIETHSGYDFSWSPTKYIPCYGGAEYHDYHHYVGEKSQSNFASVFTYCDYIYGTDKGYRYHKQTLKKIKAKVTNEGKQNGKSHHL